MRRDAKPSIGKRATFLANLSGDILRAIDGYEVKLPGFSKWRFVVHHVIDYSNRDQWCVSEVSTGYRIPCEYGATKAKAVEIARARLSTLTATAFAKHVAAGMRARCRADRNAKRVTA